MPQNLAAYAPPMHPCQHPADKGEAINLVVVLAMRKTDDFVLKFWPERGVLGEPDLEHGDTAKDALAPFLFIAGRGKPGHVKICAPLLHPSWCMKGPIDLSITPFLVAPSPGLPRLH